MYVNMFVSIIPIPKSFLLHKRHLLALLLQGFRAILFFDDDGRSRLLLKPRSARQQFISFKRALVFLRLILCSVDHVEGQRHNTQTLAFRIIDAHNRFLLLLFLVCVSSRRVYPVRLSCQNSQAQINEHFSFLFFFFLFSFRYFLFF